MANDINQNPWILDTVGTITTDWLRIRSMRWIGVDADSDDLVVTDKNGAYLWTAKALAGDATNDIDYKFPGEHVDVDGLILVTIDSGKLEIWYE